MYNTDSEFYNKRRSVETCKSLILTSDKTIEVNIHWPIIWKVYLKSSFMVKTRQTYISIWCLS
jgi:hypothetical protein